MKIIIFAAFASFALLFTSCEDFLNRTPISNANEDDFYKSETDIQLAVVAVYATLHDLYGPQSLMSYYGELMSDNAYSENEVSPNDIKQFQNGAVRADNNKLEEYWNTYYSSIYKINNVLSKLNGNMSIATTYEAELKFLRALYYFNMLQAWNRIALVVEPLSLTQAYSTSLSTPEETYSLIISDLDFAVANLPTQPRQIGTPTNGSANTLLGKVYLTQGNKSAAATALQKVYGKYSLVNYADLWDLSKKNGAESIFEIQFAGGVNNPYSRYWAIFTPYANGVVTQWGLGDNLVSDDLWNDYESADARRDLSVFDHFTNDKGSIDDKHFAKKWVDMSAPLDNQTEASNNNFIVLRYADVLLMLAEATGDAKYLNEVRSRPGLTLPLYGTSGYPAGYNTFALAVEHERRVEFALEFHRFFDLKRTGRAIDVMKNSWKHISFDENHLNLPIPQAVVDQNPNIIKQNPGY
ncbi:MAG: RagB/SusD family nutrient uptake outer membrane protein [Dysgonamonadaceae bacterium]|nr:RagB/SusD family nutrient uptake outer membrane protein [Dysgonamonadaceae bacterium]